MGQSRGTGMDGLIGIGLLALQLAVSFAQLQRRCAQGLPFAQAGGRVRGQAGVGQLL